MILVKAEGTESQTSHPHPFTDGGASSVADLDDSSAQETAPPERGARRGDVAPKESRKTVTDRQILEMLTQAYTLLGVGVMAANQYDGTVILVKADAMAASVLAVSHHHPALYRTLKRIATNTDYVVMVSVHLIVIAGIAANHGWLSSQIAVQLGAPEPPPRQSVTQEQKTARRTLREMFTLGRTPVTPQPQPDYPNGAVPVSPVTPQPQPDISEQPTGPLSTAMAESLTPAFLNDRRQE